MTADDIVALRHRLGLTRAAFAARYQLPQRTLQNYEQGRQAPPAGVLTLLKLIDRWPKEIARLLDDRRGGLSDREPKIIARILRSNR